MNSDAEKLAVTICATARYQYAMKAQARAIHANLCRHAGPIAIILVGDEGLKAIEKTYRELFADGSGQAGALKAGVEVIRIAGFEEVKGENYKNEAQLLIAQMRTAAFARARSWGASIVWSFDSDVIPKSSDCFRTLRWILEIPNSFYEVAVAPYPSQGGGDLLTGRGTPENPILSDYADHEREIPADLAAAFAAGKAEIEAIKPPAAPSPELIAKVSEIRRKIGECQPKGNVFEMNSKNGWRRRGWLSAAYPGLGRGVIVPTDWCGFGCTLLSRRALDECDFLGYDGGGTEDLFVVWHRWHQVGIRIASAIHEPASHVSRRKDGKFFVSTVRFVTDADESKGECVGHLRTIQRPFYAHDAGERFDRVNDGIPIAPEDRQAPAPAAVAPAPEVPLAPPETKAADPAPADVPAAEASTSPEKTRLVIRDRRPKK